MAEILVLTIIAALAAIYALLPPNKQLRIQYSPGPKTKIILASLAFFIILLSLFHSFFSNNYPNHTISIGPAYTSTFFLIDTAQVIATLSIVGIFLNFLAIGSTTIADKEYFNKKIRELINREEYTIAVELLDEHYNEIFHSNSDDYSTLLKTIDTVLQEDNIIDEIARYHPEFALRILADDNLDTISRSTFASNYFEGLLEHDNSIFYREIWNSREFISSYYRYRIKDENRLMTTLFSDCERAKDLAVYKPVGDWILDYLREQSAKDYDEYNDFDIKFGHDVDKTTFQDLIVASVHFFDIMVSESLYQGIEWHMWLYYYGRVTERICENFENTENTDPTDEFPNRYGYILTEIVRNQRRWIEAAEHDTDELELRIEHADCRHENGDIIKSSIRCLCRCGRVILTTEAIPSRLKENIGRDLYLPYFELTLSEDSQLEQYAEAYADCLEDQMDNMPNGEEFRRVFYGHLQNVRDDSVARSRVLYQDGGRQAMAEFRDRIEPEYGVGS
jgi:hypothetical protein